MVTDALKAGHQTPAGKTRSGVKICPAAHCGEDEGVRGDRREMLDWGAHGFASLHIQQGPGGPLALLCFHSQSSSENVSLASRVSKRTTMLEGGGQDPHLFLVFFFQVHAQRWCLIASAAPLRVPSVCLLEKTGHSVHAEGRHWISSWLKMRNRGSHLHASCSNRRTSSIKQQAVSHTLWEGRGKEQGFLIHGSVTTQLRSAGN